MLPVCLGNIFVASWNKAGWNENRIRLPGSSGVFSTCCGRWFWSGTRTCLVRSLRPFADGVSVVFWAVRFLFVAAAGCWWAVRTWALKGAWLWKVSPQVLKVKVRSAACLSCAFGWRLRTDLSENFLSQRLHSYGFSLVWVRTWVVRFPEREKVFPQVWQRCSLRAFFAGVRIEFPTNIKYDLY